jgi:hypothetical protein
MVHLSRGADICTNSGIAYRKSHRRGAGEGYAARNLGGRDVEGAGNLNTVAVQATDVAHLIQVALTPIFLISAIGVTLNVLTSRLARIVDRARAMEDELCRPDYQAVGRDLHAALGVLARRARYINAAITLITLSALFIALVVVMLFVNAFAHWELSAFIAILFILSMLALAAALTAFLIEVRIATTNLQIGIEAASRNS